MKSYLKFQKCRAGHHIVTNRSGNPLGTVEPKGQIFKRRVVFADINLDTEWTSECLRQLADFIESLESKESRPTVRAKRPAQQAKDAIKPADYEYCPHCHGSFSFAKLGSNFKCKWCKKDVRTSGRLA